MHPYIFLSTVRDMLRPGRIAVWVGLGILILLVSLLWVKMSDDAMGAVQYGMLTRLIVYRIVALAAAMFTMTVIAQEVEQKTIVYMVTRPIPRPTILWSRSVAAIVAVTLMSWISLAGVGAVMLGTGFFGEGVFWMDMLVMFLGAAAYSALFIFITLLINKAMLVILLFTFMWESFVPFLKGDMYLLTINTYMSVLATHPDKDQGLAVSALQSDLYAVSPWVAWTVLIGVFVGFMALNGWWFNKFEYLPREDAE